ncbi:MAG: hypothetical protein LBQ18_02625 [Campylobacteraceae bacterium]|nr:hypothetical protein [Campylobacteraceae bacterium]
MILYDKDTKFIGASADVLSVLGYEDMSTFMAYNNDVADLFVNKQGYVHKFDDFSWISYVLNGSLPSKNVIIKTRNGGEIEASIAITEILLSITKNDKYYLVALNNIRYTDVKSAESTALDKQPIFKIKSEEEPVSVAADLESSKTNAEESAKVTFIMDEPDTSSSFAPTFNGSKVDFPEEKIFADENANRDESLKIFKEEKKAVVIKIDIQEVSDILGISKEDVIKYMKEYASYLEESVQSLKSLYDDKDVVKIKSLLANLIGIGSNLRIKELVQSFQKLLSTDIDADKSEILQDFEEIASEFKQSALKL